jgi:hypothetical protein
VIHNQERMITETIYSLLVYQINTNFSISLNIYLVPRKANFVIKTPFMLILLTRLPKYFVGLINTLSLVLLTMSF